MRISRFLLAILMVNVFVVPLVQAAEVPFEIRQASVIINCGDKQGSGVVVNAEQGYVLTNAHVLLNEKSQQPDLCEVGFVTDQTYTPKSFYRAHGIEFVYDDSNNRDFAILKIDAPIQGGPLVSFPFVITDEFSKVHDPLTLVTYPREANGNQFVSEGTISTFDQGAILTDAFIGHGSSGGPGVDANNHLIGLARGIVYAQGSDNEAVDKPIAYELVDIRNVISWLDTFGTNASEQYLTHANPEKFKAPQAFVQSTGLSCKLLAKSAQASTVYCLKTDGTRSVFPNDKTFASWFSDFSGVVTVSDADLATYQLSTNITMKTGSMVKIESDPKVYIVADAQGTLRQIPSETKAKELFGEGWAGFVKDIPVTYFSNYTIGPVLPE